MPRSITLGRVDAIQKMGHMTLEMVDPRLQPSLRAGTQPTPHLIPKGFPMTLQTITSSKDEKLGMANMTDTMQTLSNVRCRTVRRHAGAQDASGRHPFACKQEVSSPLPSGQEKSMKHGILKSIRAACLVPLSGLCMMSAVQAQAPMPAASSAPMSNMSQGAMQHTSPGSEGMKHSMMSGMEGMNTMPMTGDTDKDFAMMMKMHHQQGVKMAKMELSQGKSPAMKAMAKKIIAAQNKEITQFDQWLSKQK
ncbi:DUF305 domain-containing protein [Aquabacterium sp. CECT 9606]|uniref:DUF305 domain-containing protein n=1 Tax=Aquabacterium sp. CECT 9606 TaxID=2845822 RepID=UPI001E594708|nr:DUF305 domain-containing protein [Aquabacterium sp. CECT 9606]